MLLATAAENYIMPPPPVAFRNTLSSMPLSILFDVAGINAYMSQAVRTELQNRVRRLITAYIQHDVDDFITLVERLHGVYIGFPVLDFVSGVPLQNETDTWELQIIMDNGAVDELIMFFTDKNEPELLITFHSESGTGWETEDLCRRAVRIQRNRVSLQRSRCVLLT